MDLILLLLLGFVIGPYNLRLGMRMFHNPHSYQQMAAGSSHPLAPYWTLPKALPWIRRASFVVMGSGILLIALAVFALAGAVL